MRRFIFEFALDINECVSAVRCFNSGTCRNTDGSYYCICRIGYKGSSCQGIFGLTELIRFGVTCRIKLFT